MNPAKKEQRAYPQTFANRAYTKSRFSDPEFRSLHIAQIKEQHSDARKKLRDLHRTLESERSKPKSQQDKDLIKELQTRYNIASANQGAARKALDMTSRRVVRQLDRNK